MTDEFGNETTLWEFLDHKPSKKSGLACLNCGCNKHSLMAMEPCLRKYPVNYSREGGIDIINYRGKKFYTKFLG